MKVGMLFPGYGSQYVGMCKDLYDHYRLIQEYFEEASNCLDTNFVKLCFASSESDLARLDNAYLSIFLTSASIASLLKEEGINPNVVAGFGLGEYAAVFTGGGLSFPDALYLLRKTSSFYLEALEGMDLKVLKVSGLTSRKIKKLCRDTETYVVSQDINDEFVVQGVDGSVDDLWKVVEENNGGVEVLDVEYGLNSALMNNVVENFKVYLTKVDFKDLNLPLIRCVDSKTTVTGEGAKSGLVRLINSPIVWDKVIKQFSDCDVIINVGPGTVLADKLSKFYPEIKIFSVNKMSDIENIRKELVPLSEIGEDTSN